MANTFTVNTVETDYRSEVAAAGLIENGQAADMTLIVRNNGNLKEVSKDIHSIEIPDTEDAYEDLTDCLRICANRESIYDSLPEGLFHQPSDQRKLRNKTDIINDIHLHRDRELSIRRFFRPFEMLIDKIGIDAQLHEGKYHKIHLHDNLSGVFKGRWRILQYLSPRQTLLFMKLTPVIGEISRSFVQTARLMSIILDCPVVIRESEKTVSILDAEDRTPLGKWKLGISSVLGKTVENDHVNLELAIGPISPSQMRTFEHNAINDHILKELIDMTVPFERHVSVKYKIAKEESGFRLSAKFHKAWLGINTTLKN
jgi:hypothetical protein